LSVENEIIKALKTKRPEFAKIDEHELELVQERAYRLHTTPPYFIKWISDDDSLGKNEIRVNQTILQKASIPTPRLIFTIKVAGASIAVWEWLDGVDLRHQQRDWLPRAFAQLGYFHAQQRHNNPVCSLVTHRSYDTIRELLKAELDFLCTYHDSSIRDKAAGVFSRLELGYPTTIHGDLHPGNIRLTKKGLRFVDWGYCTSSLGLFDLGYIQTSHFDSTEGSDWWCITPEEANSVLPAYYEACGLSGYDYHLIHQAVMLWSQLWAYYNSIKNDNKTGTEICRGYIDLLIANVKHT